MSNKMKLGIVMMLIASLSIDDAAAKSALILGWQ
jgi:hypothetical protein